MVHTIKKRKLQSETKALFARDRLSWSNFDHSGYFYRCSFNAITSRASIINGETIKSVITIEVFDPSSDTDIKNWFLMFLKMWIFFNDTRDKLIFFEPLTNIIHVSFTVSKAFLIITSLQAVQITSARLWEQ